MIKVLMKDVVSPVPPEEVRAVIRKCLEDAALVNYTRICNEARIERNNAFNPIFSYMICGRTIWLIKNYEDKSFLDTSVL